MHRLVDSIHGNKLFVFFQSIDNFFGSFHCLFCDIAGEFMFLLQIFDCFLIPNCNNKLNTRRTFMQ